MRRGWGRVVSVYSSHARLVPRGTYWGMLARVRPGARAPVRTDLASEGHNVSSNCRQSEAAQEGITRGSENGDPEAYWPKRGEAESGAVHSGEDGMRPKGRPFGHCLWQTEIGRHV
jgi:hypothetical protein